MKRDTVFFSGALFPFLFLVAQEGEENFIPQIVVMHHDTFLGYDQLQAFCTKDGNKEIHKLYDKKQRYLGQLIVYHGNVVGYTIYPSGDLVKEKLFNQMIGAMLSNKMCLKSALFSRNFYINCSFNKLLRTSTQEDKGIEFEEIRIH